VSAIQNGPQQGGALSPLFFNVTLGYSIRKAQKSQEQSEFNGTRQLLVYVGDVNLVSERETQNFYQMLVSTTFFFSTF
jgi:hypothetical protein